MDAVLVLGTIAVGLGLAAATVGVGASVRARRINGALEAISEDAPDLHRAELARPFAERLLGPAFAAVERGVRSVTPGWWLDRLRRNASFAGLGHWGVEGALALKAVVALGSVVVFVAGAAIAGAAAGGTVLWGAVGAAVGFFVPDVLIARRAQTRQDEIRRTLPEALDLLAIAVGAGMGLEQAIALVSRRLPGALGEELHRVIREVQLGATRREALGHLRERTEVPELSTFALSLAQADKLGSPLGELLRIQAAQMRSLRRQRAREDAAKVPVKLLFPLLLCIFPALGIVVVGPAIVSILRAFG